MLLGAICRDSLNLEWDRTLVLQRVEKLTLLTEDARDKLVPGNRII